jgi:hypothetical protein
MPANAWVRTVAWRGEETLTEWGRAKRLVGRGSEEEMRARASWSCEEDVESADSVERTDRTDEVRSRVWVGEGEVGEWATGAGDDEMSASRGISGDETTPVAPGGVRRLVE